jgi:hypothetical protein
MILKAFVPFLPFRYLSPATYPSILNTRWLLECWPRLSSTAVEAKGVTNTAGMS